jgi:lipoprotein-anchoring transpeptidase ErfK/SrfK
MTVRRNGRVLRVMKASMGRPEFATRNGTFVVLEKHRRRIMDSATVNLPPGTPAYRTAVEHAVRITNSGTFTHGAPWSVRDQGVRNVSHGCINLSPENAKWFYENAKRGDVVHVVGTDVPPLPDDPGSRNWNLTFEEWRAG